MGRDGSDRETELLKKKKRHGKGETDTNHLPGSFLVNGKRQR